MALIFLLAPVLLGPLVLLGASVFDEGFVVSGAMLIRRGWLPIRDFYVIYGPGQYYFTAALFAAFGEDLLVHRLAFLLQLGLIGAVLARLAQIFDERRPSGAGLLVGLAFLGVTGVLMPNAGYSAVLAVLLLLLACWALAKAWASEGNGSRAVLLGSTLIGVAGLVRWDFGVFGIVAGGLTLLLHRPPRLGAQLLQLLLPAAILMLVGFGPFIVLGGGGRWWREVPVFLLLEFNTWRGKDFLAPTWQMLSEAVAARDKWGGAAALLRLGAMATPMVLSVLGLLVSGLRVCRRRADHRDLLAMLLSLLCLFLLNQVRVRSGFPQGYPALVGSLPLLAYLIRQLSGVWMRRLLVPLAAASVVLLQCYFLLGIWAGAAFRTHEVAGLERATQLRSYDAPDASQRWQSYAGLVRALREDGSGGRCLFSGVEDTSRLFVNDALLYFLADRLPPTRWVEMEPGLSNTSEGQQELIAALERSGDCDVVQIRRLSNEANATGRSNGVHLLDEHIREHHVMVGQFGGYRLLRPR